MRRLIPGKGEGGGGSTYPRYWPPRYVVAHSFEVDHRHGRDGGRREALAGVWRVRGRQDRDDEHVDTHQERSAEEGTAATDAFDEEQQEEQAGDDLDDAEEARYQEVVVTSTNEFENLWSIWGGLSVMRSAS